MFPRPFCIEGTNTIGGAPQKMPTVEHFRTTDVALRKACLATLGRSPTHRGITYLVVHFVSTADRPMYQSGNSSLAVGWHPLCCVSDACTFTRAAM
jgi:hypothetical protein